MTEPVEGGSSRPTTVEVKVDIPASLTEAADLVRRWIAAGHAGVGVGIASVSAAFWLLGCGGAGTSVPVTPVSLCLIFVGLQLTGHKRAAGALCCRW